MHTLILMQSVQSFLHLCCNNLYALLYMCPLAIAMDLQYLVYCIFMYRLVLEMVQYQHVVVVINSYSF